MPFPIPGSNVILEPVVPLSGTPALPVSVQTPPTLSIQQVVQCN